MSRRPPIRHEPDEAVRFLAFASVGKTGSIRAAYGRPAPERAPVGDRWFTWSPLAGWGKRAIRLAPWVVASAGAPRVEFA